MTEQRLFPRKLDIRKGVVDLMHGAGGKASAQLVQELFLPALGNDVLQRGDDQASMDFSGRLVVSTDGHVVSPMVFPGGDIGALSVHGTINDIAVGAAEPLVLTAGFILEEGFPLPDLQAIAQSMGQAARESGVQIVAGDTKVVERGKGDGIYITTTGIGRGFDHVHTAPAADRLQVGDKILVSGPVGAHGIAVLAARNDLPLMSPIVSDTAALHGLIRSLSEAVPDIHALRDPTRGGLATAVNELCRSSGVGAELLEDAIPVSRPVDAAAELLGVDPLYLANEGKVIAVVAPEDADAALDAMRAHPLGVGAAVIGTVEANSHTMVRMKTVMGGHRLVDWLVGDPLPRIC